MSLKKVEVYFCSSVLKALANNGVFKKLESIGCAHLIELLTLNECWEKDPSTAANWETIKDLLSKLPKNYRILELDYQLFYQFFSILTVGYEEAIGNYPRLSAQSKNKFANNISSIINIFDMVINDLIAKSKFPTTEKNEFIKSLKRERDKFESKLNNNNDNQVSLKQDDQKHSATKKQTDYQLRKIRIAMEKYLSKDFITDRNFSHCDKSINFNSIRRILGELLDDHKQKPKSKQLSITLLSMKDKMTLQEAASHLGYESAGNNSRNKSIKKIVELVCKKLNLISN